jgi:hypothetical protein
VEKAMIFDWDDFYESNARMDLLQELKDQRSDFRCTVFAVPGLGSAEFWESVPDWIELAVHGWVHPHPRESENWTYEEMDYFMSMVPPQFVQGFKAPGWQISDGSYQWLLDHGWWVADQAYNDTRRPAGLRVYKLQGDSWHGHIQDVCGNGLEETFREVKGLVMEASEFKFVSEALA